MELGEFFSRLRGEREREQGERLTIVQIERELDGLILGNSLSALHKGLTEKANFYYVCLLCEYYGVTPNDAWNAVRDDFIGHIGEKEIRASLGVLEGLGSERNSEGLAIDSRNSSNG